MLRKKESGDIPAIGNRMCKGTQEERRREKWSGARSQRHGDPTEGF